VLAIIPFGYMSNVLGSSGRKLTTFSMHGVNRMVTLFAGLLLITQYRRRLAFSCKFTTSSTDERHLMQIQVIVGALSFCIFSLGLFLKPPCDLC